jgi:hypothetical protein
MAVLIAATVSREAEDKDETHLQKRPPVHQFSANK